MEDLPQQEIVRRLSRRFQVALVLEGLLVGVVAGGVVTLYRLVLSGAERVLRLATGVAAGNPMLMAAWFAVLAVLLACVSALIVWEPATSGSGIPQIDAEVVDRMDAPWRRVIPAKFAEGTMLALAGLSLGREGPSVQLGGMSGKAVSRALRRRRGEERLLVTCGAAAGMSAAFHAPLTGVLFALEEIHKEFTAPLIISVMCSSVASDYLVSQAIGVSPVISLVLGADLPHASYALVVVLGLLAGILGALHNRGMFACQDLFGKVHSRLPLARLAVPFALAGIVAFAWPELLCGGDAIIELLASPQGLGVTAILALLLGKYLFTTVCFGSGAPGGTLLPLVVMGALLGGLFSRAAGALGVPGEYFPNFVALGVAGLFSGVVRAPVTAVVLVFELTGSLDALLSASIVSVVAYVTANLTETESFYEHLLAALLGSSERVSEEGAGTAGGKSLQTILVGAGSRLEGMLVKEVPWPDGMRVVTIERAGGDVVPTGSTRIEALDRLLVIVDSSVTDDAFLKLRLMSSQRVL
ncbi:ClC family H(+)/Cl(-) exchange transporter [Thermophilibacter provencensis]|uniref:ClC family H(+)/Cl(-) exchange transporter n=1 Tax=Thermophilibacter provencensis TaxID=1852386 RepID=A0A921GG22_9ACTN|nr:ClC family H(+)/Cl(-) exchange transporter [Thermophilibacter provencensis]HJF46112.1 ClC family H(+)/Cl(-) exchange transporter [Thermophilibacter provencensis]